MERVGNADLRVILKLASFPFAVVLATKASWRPIFCEKELGSLSAVTNACWAQHWVLHTGDMKVIFSLLASLTECVMFLFPNSLCSPSLSPTSPCPVPTDMQKIECGSSWPGSKPQFPMFIKSKLTNKNYFP